MPFRVSRGLICHGTAIMVMSMGFRFIVRKRELPDSYLARLGSSLGSIRIGNVLSV
jgi:hypothetical protein